MNPHKSTLKLLIVAQVFSLAFLLLMPTLIRLLHEFWGKFLYAALVVGGIGLAIALRYALNTLD